MYRVRFKVQWCLAFGALLSIAAGAPAQDRWPSFLGVGAGEIRPDSIPLRWSPTENIAWKTVLPGYGQSSPVIWGDRVYVTAVDGSQKESLHVVCCSLASGDVLWNHVSRSSFPEKSSLYISRAAPTPVVDEQGVHAYFESGDIVSLSHEGALRWQVSLSERYGPPKNEFGLSASPVQLADRLIVLIDDEGPAYLTAISKASGAELWKTDRSSRRSWSSPALIPAGEGWQIVCSSGGSVDGYDPQTGQMLWTFTKIGGNTGTTPVVVSEGAFLISASPGREGENAELAKESNGLFVVSHEATSWTPKFAWTNPAPSPSWGSPIVHADYAYWVNRSGVVYCLDAATGETAYTERTKESCWATPVGLGDRVYIFGKDGLTTVLAAGSKFQILAENKLWSDDTPPVNNTPRDPEESEERRRGAAMFSRPTVYGVALVNGHIVLRTGSQLFCVHEGGSPAAGQ